MLRYPTAFCRGAADDIDSIVASRIAGFVADNNWLNYDDTTYCQGLCSGSDLHVFFIPDSVSQADRKRLLAIDKETTSVIQMEDFFSTYKEVCPEVHSLNALRKDLAYIYPAIKVMWDDLKGDRDYDEELSGNEADIIYAWCTLALAAKEPFFSEVGPISCWFTPPAQKAKPETKEAEEWMNKYGKYIETNPEIDFNGTKFVFSGAEVGGEDNPIIKKVIKKGGLYRSSVSGVTNYLVVDPRYAGRSKIVAVLEQRQKGKDIKVILLEDLEKALKGKTATKKSSSTDTKTATATKSTTAKTSTNIVSTTKGTTKSSSATSATKAVGTKASKDECDIDCFGTLTAYSGSAKEIVLPDGIKTIGEDTFLNNEEIAFIVIPEGVETINDGAFWMCRSLKSVTLPSTIQKIGENAFNSCEQLTSIIIPDGCNEIGADCFTGCKMLKDIYVTDSVYDLGDDAFCTFCDAMVIHTTKGSAAERMAKENNWKVDYKSASTGASTAKGT